MSDLTEDLIAAMANNGVSNEAIADIISEVQSLHHERNIVSRLSLAVERQSSMVPLSGDVLAGILPTPDSTSLITGSMVRNHYVESTAPM